MARGVNVFNPQGELPALPLSFYAQMEHVRMREAHRERQWRAKCHREAARKYARAELARRQPLSAIIKATGLTYEQVKVLQADVERKRKRSPLVRAQPSQWWR